MESFETHIREAFITRRAAELCHAMKEQEYQSRVKDAVRNVYDNSESDDLLKTLGEMDSYFSDHVQIILAAAQVAQTDYLTREQVEGRFRNIDKEYVERADVKDYGFIDFHDTIVARLLKIAKKDGIQNALTEEAEYEVTRSLIPNKEEYVASHLGYLKESKEAWEYLHEAMVKRGEAEPFTDTIEDRIVAAIEDVNELAREDMVRKKADKIYGA